MRPERGASPVGMLSQLPEAEAWWVRVLRLWCEGEEGRGALRDQVTARMGPAAAAGFLERLADLMSLTVGHARRPLMRHSLSCDCVGADEAVFALFCATAVQDREEAMMIGCLLIRADLVPIAVSLAQTLGLTLLRPVAPAGQRLN